MNNQPLAGKLALVTGVDAGGIGQGIALELACQGADVAVHYPYASQGAEEAVAQIQALGRRAATVCGDFTADVAVCAQVVDEAANFLGGLDILINNTGLTETINLADLTQAHWDKLFHINVRSHMFCASRAVFWMQPRGGGNILNLASVHAFGGMKGHSVYAATKGAIMAMTRELGVELAPLHIRVNAIAPGLIEVPRYHQIPNYSSEQFGKFVPWGRIGKPADIARVAAFLVSDAADFITGVTLLVDGGTMAEMPFAPYFNLAMAK